MTQLTLLIPLSAEAVVSVEKSVYVPNGTFYFFPNDSTKENLKTIQTLEAERNAALKKYNNVLKGLRYFESKVLRD